MPHYPPPSSRIESDACSYLKDLYDKSTRPHGQTMPINEETKTSETPPETGDDLPECDVKVILLGDSAVGKSKLVERFLMDDYNPRQLSTYALTLFRKNVTLDTHAEPIKVDFWDTAGQERFNQMHPSYYYQAHVCILVFDVTRKQTYVQLKEWYRELREYCEHIPCILVANKIDVDYQVTKKTFKFASQNDLEFYFVSAADGTNIVKVFEQAIKLGMEHKEKGPTDFVSECLELFDDVGVSSETKEEEKS